MHRTLQTPELFSLIFHFLNAYDLLTCALSCHLWRDEALALQWKVGPVKLVSAMKKLAPVTQTLVRKELVFLPSHPRKSTGGYFPRDIHPPEAHMIRITLKEAIKNITRERWQAFLACTAKIRVLDMTEDHLCDYSVQMLHQLTESYGGPVFPAAHTIINLSCCESEETFEVIASPHVTHVELTDYKVRFNRHPDDVFGSITRKTPNLRHLTICGLRSLDVDASPLQDLQVFQCHMETFRLEFWVGLSRCPLLENVWLSFEYGGLGGSSPGCSQPVTFPALKYLTLAMEGGVDLTRLLKMSAMPSLSRAVVLSVAELDLEDCDEIRAHLESNSPSVREVEFGDNPGGDEMRRSLLSASNQLYSNGTFGRWDASDDSATDNQEYEPDEASSEATGSDS